jgi:hypothetical protein
MKRTWNGLKHALTSALKGLRARALTADAAHRAILARKEAEQLRLIRGNFHHFL